jgi:hypothetical protein
MSLASTFFIPRILPFYSNFELIGCGMTERNLQAAIARENALLQLKPIVGKCCEFE